MDVQGYIDSGVLYDYAAGALTAEEQAAVEHMCALYPEVQEELSRLQASLAGMANAAPVAPPPVLEESIWEKLDNINRERTGDIASQPLINKYSNYEHWAHIAAPFIPADTTGDRYVIPMRHSGGVTQVLIISRTDVPEETHEHERESFLILEGECECHIGDEVIRLGPGGFVDVPLHVSHNVRILSPQVTAVLQHIAI